MENLRILHEFKENKVNHIIAESTSESHHCPRCGVVSKTKHSKYTRKITHGSMDGVTHEIVIIVRRFKCIARECIQKIFSERLSFASPYSRLSNDVTEFIKTLALSTSAEKVSKLLLKLGITISHDIVLRVLKKLTTVITKNTDKVINIGVDDFAFKKSKRYCTLICDMDKNKILDILPSRNKEHLVTWLKDNPDIKLVSRDGSITYNAAIREALPDAVQVSDKFHLIKNLLDAISKHMRRKYPSNLIITNLEGNLNEDIIPQDKKLMK